MQQQQKKRIAIFGSTGSIGTQALEVIEANPDLFEVEILTAHTNDELLVKQALQFNPNAVVIVDEKKYQKVKDALASTDVKVFTGEQSLEEVAAFDTYDMMLAAIVGFAGLKPGDYWCVCVTRWRQALDAGYAPPVKLAACHEAALNYVSLEDLRRHAL